MGPLERDAAKRRGRHRLDAMRRRTTLLRERVVITAIVSFVLLWAVVFVQMATGNDPVLAGKTTRRKAANVAARDPERPSPQVVAPPEAEPEAEAEMAEAEAGESEELEVERLEAEEAEAVELAEIEAEEAEAAELEAVTSGQS